MVVLAARWLKSRRKKMVETNPWWASADRQKRKSVRKENSSLARQVRNPTPGWASLARNPEIKPQHDEQPGQQDGSAGKGKNKHRTYSLGMNLREARPAGEGTRWRQQAVTEIAHKNENRAEMMGMAAWDHERKTATRSLSEQDRATTLWSRSSSKGKEKRQTKTGNQEHLRCGTKWIAQTKCEEQIFPLKFNKTTRSRADPAAREKKNARPRLETRSISDVEQNE
jgi:hypothetical protein